MLDSLSQLRDETRSSLAPLLYALKRGAIRPVDSYFELFKSSSLNWERYGRIPIVLRGSTWSKHPSQTNCGIPTLE